MECWIPNQGLCWWDGLVGGIILLVLWVILLKWLNKPKDKG